MSIEKGPDFRIVGGASPEAKQEIKEELRGRLFDHLKYLSIRDRAELAEHEHSKSERTLAIIDFANKETNRLRQEAGMTPYDIPRENYHIISDGLYNKVAPGESSASAFYCRQGVFLNEKRSGINPLCAAENILHETLHLKGHLSFEAAQNGDRVEKSVYRSGVSVMSEQRAEPPEHEHFRGLNEAIVAAETKKLFSGMLDLPALKKEKEWLTSGKADEVRKKISAKSGMPEDDFLWVEKKDNELKGWRFPYAAQREVLDYVCAKIQKDNAQEYHEPDDVFNEFLKSHFTGQLLSVARLVEKTFGQGSFRKLGDMTSEEESAVLHLKFLKKARSRQLKSKNN